MTFATASVTVTTTAQALTGTDSDNLIGSGICVKNTGATTCYIGGSDVTSANGYPLAAGEAFAADSATGGDVLYARTASGTTTVAVLRSGV